MIRRFPAVMAAVLAIAAACAVSVPAMAQDSKMDKRADRITKMFDRLDRNGDGVVDRSEIEGRLGKAFARIDANGDNVVDRSEIDEMRAKREKRGKGKGAQKFVKKMQRADENRDGKVTQSEFFAMTPRWFQRADENRDGRVTKAELDMFLDKKERRGKRD